MSSLRKVPQPDGRRSAKSSRAFSALVPWLTTEIAALDPSCFASVMATGIISNAFFFAGVRAWSDALFVVNLVALLWLILITALRALAFRPALWADLIDPRKVFGFFTIIAGVDVFGAALALRSLPALALALWLAALVLWVLLIYFSFGVLIFLNTARGANIVHGGWLNAIVATQSLVVLGTMIAPTLAGFSHATFVLIHVLWGVGLGLYGIFIALFAHRIFFADVEPDDVTPLLWVVMGAAAISANAGSTLILTDSGLPFSQRHAAVHRRCYPDRLGMGDLVDSAPGVAGTLEARHSPCSADLYADALEPRLSTWHVCSHDRAAFARSGFCSAATHCARHDVDRARGLGRDRFRPCHRIMAKLSALRPSGRARIGFLNLTAVPTTTSRDAGDASPHDVAGSRRSGCRSGCKRACRPYHKADGSRSSRLRCCLAREPEGRVPQLRQRLQPPLQTTMLS
ncbi:MAG: tellurite resistance/C4-dicarboxylate transporter family protein [Xanthobacteraceae bacterium]